MKLDPDIRVASLLIAIPSSVLVFNKLGIVADANDSRTLLEMCTDGGIGFEEFLQALDEIDWNEESPPSEG